MYKQLGFLAVTILAASLANAAPVVFESVKWKVDGDNLVTRDPVAKLEWLDLTVTEDLTYNEVYPQLAAGGEFDGWRYANGAEMIALWQHFGFAIADDSAVGTFEFPEGHGEATLEFMNFFGNLWSEYPAWGAGGVYGDLVPVNAEDGSGTGQHYVNYVMIASIGIVWHRHTANGAESMVDDASSNTLGHFLVRDAPVVPIPAAGWLLVSGLTMLGAAAARRSRGTA